MKVDLDLHPVVGLVLQVEDTEKFPHALGFESLYKLLNFASIHLVYKYLHAWSQLGHFGLRHCVTCCTFIVVTSVEWYNSLCLLTLLPNE